MKTLEKSAKEKPGTKGVGWGENEEKVWQRGCKEKEMCRLADRQTHTHTHTHTFTHAQTQAKVTLPSPPLVLRQTGSKMLYFPSKLKCQLILMWK